MSGRLLGAVGVIKARNGDIGKWMEVQSRATTESGWQERGQRAAQGLKQRVGDVGSGPTPSENHPYEKAELFTQNLVPLFQR